MNTRSIQMLSALLYSIVYVLAPFGVAISLIVYGTTGVVIGIFSMACLSIGYVWRSLTKCSARPIEAAIETLFWFSVGWSIVFTAVAISIYSWPALCWLLITSGTSLLVWGLANNSTRARIKRAPIV